MKKLTLPTHPKEVTAKALKALPSARVREVLERRFGLRGKDPETLESIGRSFGITRERVRQIEADGIRHFTKSPIADVLAPTIKLVEAHFADHGNVFEERKLLNSIAEPRFHNHVNFLLAVGNPFRRAGEEEQWHDRWFTKEESLKVAAEIITKTAGELRKVSRPIPAAELFQILKTQAKEVLGSVPSPDVLESYLGISKEIKQNPYGEFGLVLWPTIRPKGVRDRAYAVLSRTKKPMHFREVASAITKSGWSSRKAHPQTVHNELIKDPRFVLVGRGLYTLSEHGFMPGTVGDVIASVLKASKKPLLREDIVKQVLEQRFVKPSTIFLNLQNKNRFKRTDGGYTLI